MVFFLASLSNDAYKALQDVYSLYEDGKLVKVPKSKLGTMDSKLDCRGSNFKGLRNLENNTVTDLLKKVASKEIPFTSIASVCKELKNKQKLKEEFVRLVGATSWEEAEELYPEYANENVLERKFKGIPFAKDMPSMVHFCQKAMRYIVYTKILIKVYYLTDYFVVCRCNRSSVMPREIETLTNFVSYDEDGIKACAGFFPLSPTSLSFSDLERVIPSFPGFALTLLHLPATSGFEEVRML